MKTLNIHKAILPFAFITAFCLLCSCTNERWERSGKYGEKDWPLSISNGVEKYEFNYCDNTVIHYFDDQNAEKIWFKFFKNPQKDVLKRRHVIKVKKYMDDGWVYYYRDETKGKKDETKEKHDKRKESGPNPVVPGVLKERMNPDWPWYICKGSEKYVFDYINKTVDHYFDALNAEKIWFSTIQDPQKDVLELNNVTKRIEKYIDNEPLLFF